jgi:hypothetical protein
LAILEYDNSRVGYSGIGYSGIGYSGIGYSRLLTAAAE